MDGRCCYGINEKSFSKLPFWRNWGSGRSFLVCWVLMKKPLRAVAGRGFRFQGLSALGLGSLAGLSDRLLRREDKRSRRGMRQGLERPRIAKVVG